MSTRQYIGARYVPKIFNNPNGSAEWIKETSYEALTIVTYLGNSYTSKKPVPVNTDITNSEYWVITGNYNAQVEEYRKEVELLRCWVTPQMFGAKGDGITDDTDAFIEAFKHKTVLIPNGTYVIKKGLSFGGTIIGADETNTVILFKGLSSGEYALTITSNFTSVNNLTIIGEYEANNASSKDFNGVKCDHVWNLNFTNLQVRKFTTALYLNYSWNNFFKCATFSSCETGILGDSEVNNVVLEGCFVKYNTNGFIKKDGTNVYLTGSDFSYNKIGYKQEGIGITSVESCYFEDNETSIAQSYGLKPTDLITIHGCSFYSGKRETETVIKIANGNYRITGCFFKNLGNYTPLLANKALIMNDCKITGSYNMSNTRNIPSIHFYQVEGTSIFLSLNYDGLATLVVNGIGVKENNVIFTLPDNFIPYTDYVGYATFKTTDGDSIDLEFTLNTNGNVSIDKLPDKVYSKGNLTLSYVTVNR